MSDTRKPSASRDRVVRVSRELFAADGVAGASMRDIAEALQIQAPSLYSHFASKAVLVEACIEPYVEAALSVDGAAAPRDFVAGYAAVLSTHRDGARIVHLDPSLRTGRRAREIDESLGAVLTRFGAPRPLVGPLLAFVRARYVAAEDAPASLGELLGAFVAGFLGDA
jgi:AcrR family transcriptional regulator